MDRQVVKFNGTPEQVELMYSTGVKGHNDKGEYYTYGLAGNRVMFATPALNQVIQNLKPRKGTRLSIQLTEGNRWDVRVETPAEQPVTETPAAQPMEHERARDPKGDSGHAVEQQRPNGNTQRIPDAPYSHTGWAAHIREQAMSLIDVAASCHRYAAEKYPGLLDDEKVASLVITVYIQHSKGGGCQ